VTKFIVAHRKDPNNVGDIASQPLQYFLKPDQYQVVDIANLRQERYDATVPLIVGGGGLFGNANMGDVAAEVLASPDRRQLQDLLDTKSWDLVNHQHSTTHQEFLQQYQSLVARTLEKLPSNTAPRFVWGAGINSDVEKESTGAKYSRWLGEYRSVGVRDWFDGNKFSWAPCASCMHPALQIKYAIKNDVIWFEHKKQLIKDFGSEPIPRFVNSGSNIDQTIEILGSANIVLTNSYHGAYWATLMGKRVVVVDAWSSKFRHMKHPPVFANKKDNWRDRLDLATSYTTALDECIEATQTHWSRIQEQL
jgi:hypothetical protein